MCARIALLPAGKLLNENVMSTVPPVIALPESRVGWNVIVAVPRPVDSALLTGGTSLAALNCAVKTMSWFDGAVGLSSHAAPSTSTEKPSTSIPTRFIVSSSMRSRPQRLVHSRGRHTEAPRPCDDMQGGLIGSSEPPREIEAEIDVARFAASRGLTVGRAKGVRQVD